VVRDCIVFSARPAATTTPGVHSPAADCIHEHDATTPSSSSCHRQNVDSTTAVGVRACIHRHGAPPRRLATPSSRLSRDVATVALKELKPVTFALSLNLYCASIVPTSSPPTSWEKLWSLWRLHTCNSEQLASRPPSNWRSVNSTATVTTTMNPLNHSRLCETHPNSRKRKCCHMSGSQWTIQKSNWSTSQLWARIGQLWSICLFYAIFGRWFLYRNPKLPKRGKNHLAAVHRWPDNSWKFPRNNKLKRIKYQSCSYQIQHTNKN